MPPLSNLEIDKRADQFIGRDLEVWLYTDVGVTAATLASELTQPANYTPEVLVEGNWTGDPAATRTYPLIEFTPDAATSIDAVVGAALVEDIGGGDYDIVGFLDDPAGPVDVEDGQIYRVDLSKI